MKKSILLTVAGLTLLASGCADFAAGPASPTVKNASAPKECPDWSANPVYDYSNNDEFGTNAGCVTDSNIRAQLYDPEDYKMGHGSPEISELRDDVIVQGYLSGAGATASGTAGSTAPSTSSGR